VGELLAGMSDQMVVDHCQMGPMMVVEQMLKVGHSWDL
jgi:hypothetical protein